MLVSKHEAGIASEASGQCEVIAKCERNSQATTERGEEAPRADANDEKGRHYATNNAIFYLLALLEE